MKIGLIGEARSGKDTIGEYLSRNHQFNMYAFGDELKKAFHNEFYMVPKVPKPVRGYQLYGQLQRYAIDDLIWIKRCFYHIKKDNHERVVITDIRQKNEVEECLNDGYILIGIDSKEEVRKGRMEKLNDNISEEDLNFETESEVEGLKNEFANYIVKNNKDLEHLYEQINIIVSDMKSGRVVNSVP